MSQSEGKGRPGALQKERTAPERKREQRKSEDQEVASLAQVQGARRTMSQGC